jgi:outer membrane protein OmpA-like peptidoglycan-associated protein
MRQTGFQKAFYSMILGVAVFFGSPKLMGQQLDNSRGRMQRVHEVIVSNVNFFLDGAVEVDLTLGEVNWRMNKRQILAQMEKIVRDVNSFQTLNSEASFRRFSPEVDHLIERVDKLSFRDLRRWRMAAGLSESQEWYVMVQSALDELKMQVAMELNVHFNEELMSALVDFGEREQEDLLSGFDMAEWIPNSALPSLDWTPSAVTQAELSSIDRSEWVDMPSSDSPKELEEWFDRILHLLEAQERRLVKLEGGYSNSGTRGSENWLPFDSDPALANLHIPESLDIGFSLGSYQLGLSGKMQLHEIMELMGRYPQIRVICTGHADSSGERMSNLLLSKQRAQVVQAYLLESGVSSHRVLLNYFGESRERQGGSKDRRVEVTFYLN